MGTPNKRQSYLHTSKYTECITKTTTKTFHSTGEMYIQIIEVIKSINTTKRFNNTIKDGGEDDGSENSFEIFNANKKHSKILEENHAKPVLVTDKFFEYIKTNNIFYEIYSKTTVNKLSDKELFYNINDLDFDSIQELINKGNLVYISTFTETILNHKGYPIPQTIRFGYLGHLEECLKNEFNEPDLYKFINENKYILNNDVDKSTLDYMNYRKISYDIAIYLDSHILSLYTKNIKEYNRNRIIHNQVDKLGYKRYNLNEIVQESFLFDEMMYNTDFYESVDTENIRLD